MKFLEENLSGKSVSAFYNFSDDSIWIIDFFCYGPLPLLGGGGRIRSYGLIRTLDIPCFNKSERFRNFKFEIALFKYLGNLKIKISSLSN